MGLATGDFDADGRQDLVVVNTRGDHRLLLNNTPNTGNWITVRLAAPDSNPAGLGARLELDVGEETLIRAIHAGDGYNGQNTYRVHFGLGPHARADSLRVRWPDGSWESFADLEEGNHYVVERGSITTMLPSNTADREDWKGEQSKVTLWPNPADDMVDIAVNGLASGSVRLVVLDALGRRIHAENVAFSTGEFRTRVDLSALSPGLYLIQVSDGRTVRRSTVVRR